VVGDDTPYIYTEREVRRTGLPRYDRLLRIARETPRNEVKLLLVMPTWRASLVDARLDVVGPAERLAAFARSEYARHWRALLNNATLRQRVREVGLRLAYVPHANAEPFLSALEIPPEVEVVTFSSGKAEQAFSRTAAFITDYTSVAFTFALLRRPMFYYQFDQKAYYGGGHNWRPGYFDFARDGFGPVALTEVALMAELEVFFASGCRPNAEYLERMERAMPERGEAACSAAFDAIIDTARPVAALATVREGKGTSPKMRAAHDPKHLTGEALTRQG
jgi:CDP-glycerol glycerophosphotransferase (TagB/SpsB family)